MRVFLKLLAILLLAEVAFIASFNNTVIELKLWHNIVYNINLIYVFAYMVLIGLTSGAAWVGSYYFTSKNKLKEYKRKLEKHTVDVECESSKVAVLESKIEVLEKALKSALEKNKD